jgi:hypothetical protein
LQLNSYTFSMYTSLIHLLLASGRGKQSLKLFFKLCKCWMKDSLCFERSSHRLLQEKFWIIETHPLEDTQTTSVIS